MLRMGKNPKAEQSDTEHNTDSQTSSYNTSPSYGSSTQQQPRQEMPSYRSPVTDPTQPRAISNFATVTRDAVTNCRSSPAVTSCFGIEFQE